jgi:hypothetical protein
MNFFITASSRMQLLYPLVRVSYNETGKGDYSKNKRSNEKSYCANSNILIEVTPEHCVCRYQRRSVGGFDSASGSSSCQSLKAMMPYWVLRPDLNQVEVSDASLGRITKWQGWRPEQSKIRLQRVACKKNLQARCSTKTSSHYWETKRLFCP